LAQLNVWVMAPKNGSEHFVQKGAVIRGALLWQLAQRYSRRPAFSEQTTQVGG
jgi:hypothetical protein